MDFTLSFFKLFIFGLFYISPVLLMLLALMVAGGMVVGHLEGWSKINSLYYTFVTATTVGYGDFKPKRVLCKMLAISIAFLGLIFTGIIVAVALNAVSKTFENSDRFKSYNELKREIEDCRAAEKALAEIESAKKAVEQEEKPEAVGP